MRIISGIRRGHKLIDFNGDLIRPTTDRVKESIFSIINNFIPNSKVLDLFSGSGALAYEALSRGADLAVCVDSDKNSVEIIKKNAENLKFGDCVKILNSDAINYLNITDIKFNIILLDPPYNKGFIRPVLEKIAQRDILCDGGIIMLESDCTDVYGDVEGLLLLKQKKYGRTYVTIYKKGE